MVRKGEGRTAERRIHFYRVHVGLQESGERRLFNAKPVLKALHAMPFEHTGRYQVGADDTVYCAWVDKVAKSGQMRFATIRRSGLPEVEQAGKLSSLSIEPDAGLAEPTHMVFFHNNILGTVFNFYGPRPTRFAAYLEEKTSLFPDGVVIEPLLRQDVLEEFKQLRNLRMFDLKIRPSYAEDVAEIDENLSSAFKAAQAVGDPEFVQIVMRTGRKRDAKLSDRVREIVPKLLRRGGVQEGADRFVVGGHDAQTGKMHYIDLLNDKLVMKKSIIKQGKRSRALDADAAYQAITDAYEELRPQLEVASSIAE